VLELRQLHGLQLTALVLVAGRILCSDNNAGSTYGTFEWTPVLRALGWSTSRPHELYPHLERGFSYWRLKLYNASGRRTHYLASTLLAGGLPVAWLSNEKHPVGGLLRSLLSRAGRLERRPSELEWQADSGIGLSSLDPSTVRALCIQLADELWDLRAELQASGSAPSATALARFGPQWTTRISIQWKEPHDLVTVVDALLAVANAGSVGLSWIRFDTYLDANHLGRLIREVRLVHASLPPDRLPPELCSPNAEESNEFIVSALTPEGGRHVLGRLERTANGLRVLPDVRVLRLSGRKGVTLLIAAVGEPILALSPPGGETLDTQEPWVFEEVETMGRPGMHRLLGTGNVRTSRPGTLISILETSRIESDPPPELLPFTDTGERRLAFRVQANARVLTAECEEYSVRLGVVDEDPSSLSARGNLWWATGSRRPIWLSLPTLWVERGDTRTLLPPGLLEWRPKYVRPLVWRSVRETPPAGRVVIRYRDTSGQSTTGEFDILPRDFRVTKGDRSEILVSGSGIEKVETFGAAVEKVVHPASTFRVSWRNHDIQRSELPTTVHFRHGSKLHIDLPTLQSDACFVDRDGHVLRVSARVALERTRGVRVMSCTATDLNIYLRSPRKRWRLVCTRSPRNGDYTTVFLDELFSTMDAELRGLRDLDERISLSVEVAGDAPGRHVIEVGWYDVVFAFNPVDGGIFARSVSGGAGAEEVCRVELRTLSLAKPANGILEWPTSDLPCRWEANPSALEAGPWLFWGVVDGELRARPTFQLVKHEHETSLPCDSSTAGDQWARTARLATREEREVAWHELLSAMAVDLNHEAWRDFRGVLTNTGQLPAISLDVLRCLGANPKAAATLLLYQSDSNELARAARKLSEVGFLPGMATLSHWGGAIRSILHVTGPGTETARLLGSDRTAFREFTKAHFDTKDGYSLHAGCDFVRVVLDLAHRYIPGVATPSDPSLSIQLLEGY
jgi:hypothetical protein